MGDRIVMKNPVVDMGGDEMAGVIWDLVKEKLLEPFVDLKTEYYDLSIKKRDDTDDQITLDAAEAIKKHKVGAKCATITPNAARVDEYGLKKQWKSPNATIRAALDGTVFREPILLDNIKPAVRFWKKPIIIGRHAYGDVYKNTERCIEGPCKAELVFTSKDGKEIRKTIQEFDGPGIVQATHNLDGSIKSFAKACFSYALDRGVPLWFATKDTISKTYDGYFKETFEKVFEEEGFKEAFEKAGLSYFYTLIDDAVARVVRSEGGFLWACKNYDGDVMSDFIGSAYGSLGLLKSVLVSPFGCFEYEAAHGTVQQHYYRYLNQEETSTNSTAIIYAWSGALKKRGQLDALPELVTFAQQLEKTTEKTIQKDRIMTKDLAHMSEPPAKKVATTTEFIDAVASRMNNLLNSP